MLFDEWLERVGELYPLKETLTENFDVHVNSTHATECNERSNEHTNGRTNKWKDESYKPLSINVGGITTRNPFFLLTFPVSDTYLKLRKPKGLGELCAATSDLASQTGIEKNRSFDYPKAELDISKNIYGPWKPGARNRTRLSFYACRGYQQL